MWATFQAPIGFCPDVAVLNLDLRTHHFQTVDMQVDRTAANGAATGQGHFRLAKVRNQGTQHQNGCAHGFHQLVGRVEMLDGAGVDFHAHFFINHQLHAHTAEQLNHGGYVVEMGQVANGYRFIGKQCGCQNRQSGVFGTGDPDFAIQWLAAPDQKFIHYIYPFLYSACQP